MPPKSGSAAPKPLSSEELLPLVYEELRQLAARRIAGESGPRTLQPTALVHEAWIRLRRTQGGLWQNRAHFFGAAAQAMRRILVDHARRRLAAKRRPANSPARSLADPPAPPSPDHILLVHESLARLERENPAAARIVSLKFFSGLASAEIARIEGCSTRSVERRWSFAKARLYQMIRAEGFARGPATP